MIGIKIKNSCWEKALLSLLKERAEVWQSGKDYQEVISDKVGKTKSSHVLVLNHKQEKFSLSLPFKMVDLERLLAQLPNPYENDFFKWDFVRHQLKNKKTNALIYLTEKEAKIINFLSSCPQKEATKEELLRHVWHYTTETETHTVESTIYALRQKLGQEADKLILPVKTGYRLV